jgi:hypothetical protein
VSVCILALVTRHTNRILSAQHNFLTCGLAGCTIFFFTLSHKRHDFQKKVTEHEICAFIFSTHFVCDISHSKKNSARCHEYTMSSRKVPPILVEF